MRVTVRRLDAVPGTGVALAFGSLLRRYHDDRLALVGADGHPLPRLEPEEHLLVEQAVQDDAMYVQPAVVGPGGTTREIPIEPVGEQRRHQQRAFVRVQTLPIEVVLDVVPQDAPTAEDAPPPVVGTIRDVSAGGLRLAYEGDPLVVGRALRTRFVLTKDDGRPDPMDLRAEVCWTGRDVDGDRWASGLRFVGIGRALETRLTAFVFREEAKRLRAARDRGRPTA